MFSQESIRYLETTWLLVEQTGKEEVIRFIQRLIGEVMEGVKRETSPSVSRATLVAREKDLEEKLLEIVRTMQDRGLEERAMLQDTLDIVRREIELVRQAQNAQGEELREIERRQREILAHIDSLRQDLADIKARLAAIEGQLTNLTIEVTALRRAQIRDCLDLVDARRVGFDGYPVSDRPGNLREGEGRVVGVDAWADLYLDSCSPDLIQRGLLIQSSLIARDAEGELSMRVTVSSVRDGSSQSQSFDYFLGVPLAPVDGQVREFFLPYDELPVFPTAGRTAVAVVLTLGDKVVYQLPPRPFSCSPGAQIDCVWR